MARQSKKPSLFTHSKEHMNSLSQAIERATLDKTYKQMQQNTDEDTEIQRMPKYLQVTQKRMDKEQVYDMKPYFRRSPNVKAKKDGGWYMVVPIRRKKSSMSRRMYDEMRGTNIKPDTERTVVSKYLYDKRGDSDSEFLSYTPKSKNITKQRTGNNRHTYVAFRTVSDESSPSSWIMNRHKVNKDQTSKTFVKNVDRLIKWQLKNLS